MRFSNYISEPKIQHKCIFNPEAHSEDRTRFSPMSVPLCNKYMQYGILKKPFCILCKYKTCTRASASLSPVRRWMHDLRADVLDTASQGRGCHMTSRHYTPVSLFPHFHDESFRRFFTLSLWIFNKEV